MERKITEYEADKEQKKEIEEKIKELLELCQINRIPMFLSVALQNDKNGTKYKNIITGAVLEKSFRPTEKFPQARIDRVDMSYLYNDGDLYNFMNTETYDQVALTKEQVGDSLKFVKENEVVKVCSWNGNVYAIEPPLFVELEVIETEPGFAGNTAQGATKPATVETGAQVMVPLFVNQGDKLKIDTRTGEYLSRV